MKCALCAATMVPVNTAAGLMLVHAWELEALLALNSAA